MEPIKQVTLEKTYDAPLEMVWKAWTDPEELKKWWGPDNVTIPESEVDLRVGGKFYIVMEAGEAMGPYKGTKWPMLAEFTVVVPNSQLSFKANAWTEGDKDNTTIDQTTDISFTDESPDASAGVNKTKVKVVAIIHKAGPGAAMAAEGMQQGFTEQLEKLGNYLKKSV